LLQCIDLRSGDIRKNTDPRNFLRLLRLDGMEAHKKKQHEKP
jgi:hypothetical protein